MDGYASIFLTLALCLAVPFGGVGIVAALSFATIVLSGFALIPRVTRLYFGEWRRSDAFRLNLLILAVTLIELGLLLYHGDDAGSFENQLKQYLIALAVLMTIRRHPVSVIVWGSAIGCVIAAFVAFHDVFVLHLERAEGPTNAIRFGMMSSLMAIFCLAAAMFGRYPLQWRLLLVLCCFLGHVAVFWSGSRGAVIALPFMLLVLLPRLWVVSRRAALALGLAFLACFVALSSWQVHYVRGGVSNFVSELAGEDQALDSGTRERIEMLRMAAHLFTSHPLLGVGSKGWDEAVAKQRRTSPPDIALSTPFNQPHNQYANDLAKGGLLQFSGGLAMILLPLWFFIRLGSFRNSLPDQGVPAGDPVTRSLAPLLGATTCVGFAVFALTDSVQDLSLTASIYAILVFYLICSSEGSPLQFPGKSRAPLENC